MKGIDKLRMAVSENYTKELEKRPKKKKLKKKSKKK